MSSAEENALIDELDDKRLAEIFLPAIKEIIKAGGGAEQILKHSEALAACRLTTTAAKGSQDAALKAAIAILDRTQGRPVERRLNVFADVASMSDEQLDREILALAKRAGAKEEVIHALTDGLPREVKATVRKSTSLSSHPDGSKPRKRWARKSDDEPR